LRDLKCLALKWPVPGWPLTI